MTPTSMLLIIGSVLLGAGAQVAFKYGMSSAAMQSAVQGSLGALLLGIVKSPAILLGLTAYGASAVSWLSALAKVQLSLAYPFVALGIVITVVAGSLAFAESLPPLRLGGIALICLGVLMVAWSHPA